PGVKGIGPKTAIKLLDEYGTLENIYANIDEVKTASTQKKLVQDKDAAFDSKFLAQIKLDCPIAYDFQRLTHHPETQVKELISFLRGYRLKTLEARLPKVLKALNVSEEQLEVYEQTSLLNITKVEEKPKEPLNKVELDISRQTIFSEEELQLSIKDIQSCDKLAIDLETDGLDTFNCNIVGWSLAWKQKDSQTYKSIYIPTGHLYIGAPSQLSNELVAKQLNNFIQEWTNQGTNENIIIAHNIKFEYKILKRYGLQLPNSSLDTMLASYVQDPDPSHGLKKVSLRELGYEMQEIASLIGPKGKSQKTMDQIEIEKVAPYACDDAALTLALTEHYLEKLENKQKDLWLNLESPLAIVLAEMELTGVYVNANKLQKLSEELNGKIETLSTEILEKLELPETTNLNSPQQLGEALASKGFKLQSTNTGQRSTDVQTLYKLEKQDESGGISKLIEFRILSKLRSTYTEGLQKQINPLTKRVHCDFNQALTTTGRLSSSNPNLQNIPIRNQEYGHLVRASFEAGEDKVLVCADYSQIELRILAHFTEDPILIDAFKNNDDIHARTAAEIFEVPVEEVDSERRRLGKTLNFALIYQQGTFATARQLGISSREASEFIDKYFETFPRVKPFMDQVMSDASEKSYVETLWGRRRYFHGLKSNNSQIRKAEERAAFNAPLQGTAADLMKKAMLGVSKQLQKFNKQSNLILQVHDEIIVETQKKHLDEIKQIIQEEMSLEQPLKVPL
ncbi:MAG TPA: DNA polymerase I, partial [Vampirovibrionales bacterium]